MNENNGIAQENVQQNSPNGQKPANAKGLIIIIIIVAAVIIGYFIMQSLDKNGGSSKADLSVISEEDRLELNSLNLQGKWNKKVGSDRYELNFKSSKELVLTQYNANDEVTVKSDEGAYNVENGVLNLTVVANGETITAAASAALSDKYLIISVTEGSELFAGTYDADMGDMPNVDNSGSVEGTAESESSKSNASDPEDSDTSNPGNSDSDPDSDPVSVYAHLSPNIIDLINKTPIELIDMSETTPEYDGQNIKLTVDSNEIVIGYYNSEYSEEIGGPVPNERSGLDSVLMPIEMLFSYPDSGITGKKSYTYEELKEIYGNSIMYEYTAAQGLEGIGLPSGEYIITAMVDGYWICFGDGESAYGGDEINRPSYGTSLDNPLKYCEIIKIGNSIPQ